jgi:hypothetical protein
VLQADKPVTIWGSTRRYGEWQDEPEKGDCKVHFEFGDIKQTIAVTPEMAEWQVTLPPMKAGPKPYTLKVSFTIDGEKKHERISKGIIFGDVWYVAAPQFNVPKQKSPKRKSSKGKKSKDEVAKIESTVPAVKPSGPIVRMMENESNRDSNDTPSRFSICVSRNPSVVLENGKRSNSYAAYWKDAYGLAGELAHSITAKTGRPVGIIFMKPKKAPASLKSWIAADFLKDAPTLMEDYKTIGAQYRDNPHYLVNAKRYVANWKSYWSETIPAMMKTKAVPDGSKWGKIPSLKADIGDSTATQTYNVSVHSFTPAALSGVIFLSGESMVADDQGTHFGSELSVLANGLKAKFGGEDMPFIYTIPSKALAANITEPKSIQGEHKAVEVSGWLDFTKVIEAVK